MGKLPNKKGRLKFETALLLMTGLEKPGSDQFTVKLRVTPLTVITTDLSQLPSP
jgi:hypothetical protein